MKKIILFLIILSTTWNGKAQVCQDPSAKKELNIGNVRASIFNSGHFWFDGEEVIYMVPNDPNNNSYLVCGGGIWLTAKTTQSDIKVSAMSYNSVGYEFYPGPIDNLTGEVDYEACQFFDQIFEVYASEIDNHIDKINVGLPIPINEIASNILLWPAKGNVHITEYNIQQDLAPFYDHNGNNIYDPENGDFPRIKGDQTLFWVMNDIGGFHESFHGDPLKVEIHMMAHAYNIPGNPISSSTFYDCKVINKSFGNLKDFGFGLFMDPHLGSNELTGCDTTMNRAYTYSLDRDKVMSFQLLNRKMTSFQYFGTTGYQFLNTNIPYMGVHNALNGLRPNGSLLCDGLSCSPGYYHELPGGSYTMPSTTLSENARYVLVNHGNDFPAWSSYDISWLVHTSFLQNTTTIDQFDPQVESELQTIKYTYNIYNRRFEVLSAIRENEEFANEIALWPNPSASYISVKANNADFESAKILSIDGKIMNEQVQFDSKMRQINIGNLASGIYFLELQTNKGLISKKFVKN